MKHVLYRLALYKLFLLTTLVSTFANSFEIEAVETKGSVIKNQEEHSPHSAFIGNWTVTKVDFPENYFGEIKYPKSFQLIQADNNEIKGVYKNQFDQEHEFSLSQLINNGHELLLVTYGTTKHKHSWAPLHKVKLIDGQLVGLVITNNQRFIWYAEPEKN